MLTSPNPPYARIVQGIPWGVFQTLTTAYAAEVTPVALRPFVPFLSSRFAAR